MQPTTRRGRHGSLCVYFGCMYAGKSTAMLRDLQRYAYAGMRCVVVKHAADTRYDSVLPVDAGGRPTGIACHDQRVYTVDTVVAATLADAASRVLEYDCIGISEAQFYDDVLLADEWADDHTVIAEGLDGNHKRECFGRLHELIPRAERAKKLAAVCVDCGADASFTRKIAGDMTADVDVGGRDKYAPVCRACYHARSTE